MVGSSIPGSFRSHAKASLGKTLNLMLGYVLGVGRKVYMVICCVISMCGTVLIFSYTYRLSKMKPFCLTEAALIPDSLWWRLTDWRWSGERQLQQAVKKKYKQNGGTKTNQRRTHVV